MDTNDKLLSIECIHCALKQISDVAELTGMPQETQRELMRHAIARLAQEDLQKYNSELIDIVYRLVTQAVGDEDPYREVKEYYNRELMKIAPELRRHIDQSQDRLPSAVRLSIVGNLIDLAASGHNFDLSEVLEKVHTVDQEGFFIDRTPELKRALAGAKTLLLLGDNCGEIVLDKILIETLHALYPKLQIAYGVRGRAAVNDVTREDARQVGMEEVAEIIDNGDGVLSTLLHRVSPEFRKHFFDADVVISKGMGNLEGLFDCGHPEIYFMLIAKCKIIAEMTHSKMGAILCIKAEDTF